MFDVLVSVLIFMVKEEMRCNDWLLIVLGQVDLIVDVSGIGHPISDGR